MPNPTPRTTLDTLRADASAAHERWNNETDPQRRLDLHLEYYRAQQAVIEAEHRAKHPLTDVYRAIPEVTPSPWAGGQTP